MSMVHDITAGAERNRKRTRKGRGRASGKGKTSGRGHKGSKARSGTYIKPGYEGGQTAIYRRLPKRGFSNFEFERRFHVVNVQDLERFEDGSTVDAAVLHEAGLVPDEKLPVKILGEGAISKKLTVVAGKYSRQAYDKITQAGGTAQNLQGEAYVFPKPKKKFVPHDAPKTGSRKAEAAAAAEAAAPAAEEKSE